MSVEKQLQKYKKRDLRLSHYDRILRKRSSLNWKVFCRHHYLHEDSCKAEPKVDILPSTTSLDLYLSLPALSARKVVHGGKSSPTLQEDEIHSSCREWVKKRKELKKQLDKFDFSISWLKRKPEKTVLEERVLARMQESGDSFSYYKDVCHKLR